MGKFNTAKSDGNVLRAAHYLASKGRKPRYFLQPPTPVYHGNHLAGNYECTHIMWSFSIWLVFCMVGIEIMLRMLDKCWSCYEEHR